jgi:hypothetical protein
MRRAAILINHAAKRQPVLGAGQESAQLPTLGLRCAAQNAQIEKKIDADVLLSLCSSCLSPKIISPFPAPV